MRVVVTGSTGFLGRAAVTALRETGHEVTAIARDRSRAERAFGSGGVRIVEGDPGESAALTPALEGADALVHAAATYSYDRGDADAMAEANPRLAESVLRAAMVAGVLAVDISSAIVFRLGAESVDEASPVAVAGDPGWDDPYLRSKARAEAVGELLEREGLRRVTLHPASVVGPGDRGPGVSGALLVSLLQGGVSIDGRLGWVDVRDVATAIVAALGAQPGRHYLVTSRVVSFPEMGGLLDSLTGRPVRRLFLPPGVARAVAGVNDLAAGRLAPMPTRGALEYALSCPSTIDGSRVERELGVRYRPIEETLADAIRWWAANGVVDRSLAGPLA